VPTRSPAHPPPAKNCIGRSVAFIAERILESMHPVGGTWALRPWKSVSSQTHPDPSGQVLLLVRASTGTAIHSSTQASGITSRDRFT
jgi:hypothetical protein